MKNWLVTLLIAVLIVGAVIFLFSQKIKSGIGPIKSAPVSGQANQPEVIANNPIVSDQPVSPNNGAVTSNFQAPIDHAGERITKKQFGIFITPQNSPVTPEKFTGYHTGTDFEIFPEELNADVFVRAVCTGKLVMKKSASGYGGVAVESCILNNQPITVVYGHLKLASIGANIGANLQAGDKLGILGAAYSSETSGERKHLHLGFHQGTAIDILGYVQRKNDLTGWLDPCPLVCHN